MTSYLLLRSNKETGPYTLEELLTLGLKPYDLVWSKGKSAAWRYPSELEELKPYAPQVEEQPYDRFYKKQELQTKIPAPVVTKISPVVEMKKEAVELIKNEESLSNYLPKPTIITTPAYIPKKSVCVTLPGQSSKTSSEKKIVSTTEKKILPPIPDYTLDEPTIKITQNPEAKVKYSQPLDEIKEMYVKTLHDRKSKIARKDFWLKNLKVASVVLGLIGIGLVAGFIIKPKQNDHKLATQNTSIPQVTPPVQDSAVQVPLPEKSQNTESINVPAVTRDNLKVAQEKNQTLLSPDPDRTKKDIVAGGDRTKEKIVTKKEVATPQPESSQFNPSERNSATGERSRTLRDANQSPTEKAIMKTIPVVTRYEGPVSVKSNDYKRVAFGGIRNLELTVTNNSKSELDNVVVELTYLKPSELPLRTENIVFKSILPNESSMIRIPDTNRGIKVTYKILSVASRDKGEAVANNK